MKYSGKNKIMSKKTPKRRKYSDSTFLKHFDFILVPFSFIGIKGSGFSKIRSTKRYGKEYPKSLFEKCCLSNWVTYLVFILFLIKVIEEIISFLFSSDWREKFASWITDLLITLLYISIYNKRGQIIRMIKNLSQLMKMHPETNLKIRKYPYLIFSFLPPITMIACNVYAWLKECLYMVNQNTNLFNHTMEKAETLPMLYVYCLIRGLGLVYSVITWINFCVFANYYVFICNYIRILFQSYILDKMYEHITAKRFECILIKNEVVLLYINNLDDHFSYSVFITILITMISLFLGGYTLAFSKNVAAVDFFGIICHAIFLLCYQTGIMISGSLTNEMGNKVKTTIRSVFSKISKHQLKNTTLKSLYIQDGKLTLWKIYALNRSIFLSSFATLLTYGILLGTLGK